MLAPPELGQSDEIVSPRGEGEGPSDTLDVAQRADEGADLTPGHFRDFAGCSISVSKRDWSRLSRPLVSSETRNEFQSRLEPSLCGGMRHPVQAL